MRVSRNQWKIRNIETNKVSYFALKKSVERRPLQILKRAKRLIMPRFLRGRPNVWDNLRILRKAPLFQPLRMALLGWLIFALILSSFGIYFLKDAAKVQAVSFTFNQTDWSSGATSNNHNHTNEQANPGVWTEFASSSSNIKSDTAGEASLEPTTTSSYSETSDTDFNAGTDSSTVVSSGSVILDSTSESGLVGLWHFNETAMNQGPGGTDAEDSSDNSNHGTAETSMTDSDWVSGNLNNALDFDGSNDRVDIGDADNLDFGANQDFTVSAWIKTTQTIRGDICGKGDAVDSGDRKNWSLYIYTKAGNGNDQVIAGWIDDGTNSKAATRDGTIVNDGEWHHVVVVFDRDGNMTRYADGAQTGTEDNISAVGDISSSDQFAIGTRGNKTDENPELDNPFDGIIDEVVIYSRVLSGPLTNCTADPDNEICDHYNSGAGTELSPSAYFNSGNFTSQKIDIGRAVDFTTMSWGETLPTDTDIQFQIRSASTEAGLSSTTWYGPTSTGDYYTTNAGENINSVHDNDRWIQYKAYLSTTDTSNTSSFNDITINYQYQGYPTTGEISGSESGLVGLWHFNETAMNQGPGGTDAEDSSGNSNHGTAEASMTDSDWVSGNFNNALDFDGNDDYVDLDYTIGSDLDGASAITMEAWIKNDDLPPASGFKYIFGTRVNSAKAGAEMCLYDSNKLRVAGRSADPEDGYQYKETSFTTTDQWKHVVGILDYANNRIKIYIDGDEKINEAVTFTNNTYTRGTPTQEDRIAINPGMDDGKYFNGIIDEVAVYNRVLSASEILQHYYSAYYLTSSPYNTEVSDNTISSINWTENLPTGTDIKFQLRTAPDSSGSPGTWSDWLGPTSSADYYTDPSGGETINSTHTDGADDQWVQYKVFLSTTDSSVTPTLSNFNLNYGYSAPVAFDLLTLTDSSTTLTNTPILTWEESSGNLDHYEVYIDDSKVKDIELEQDGLWISQVKFQDAATQIYLGSPSLLRLSSTTILATHDYFGPGSTIDTTAVYRSIDNGNTWTHLTNITGAFWSNLFEHNGNVYLLGVYGRYGNIVIRRSDDNGETWTNPVDASSGLLFTENNYHTAPMPVAEINGRLYRAFEYNPTQGWPEGFQSFVISIDVDDDLLNASNWTMSNKLVYDQGSDPVSWTDAGWLEGNMVETPGNELWNILRVNSTPDVDKATIVKVLNNGQQVTFDPINDFIDFPGGMTKFTIRKDSRTGLYWTLSNNNTDSNYPNQRNVLSLHASSDLRNWYHANTLMEDDQGLSWADSIAQTGFQYADWHFDGENIIYLVRTAYDGAHDYHDANRITFGTVYAFRRLTPVNLRAARYVEFKTSSLGEGAHTWYVKAVNNASRSTQSSSTYTFIVNTVAPNAPTLVSPADALVLSDTTPTLSANYSDSGAGNTGTTNYRISSSSLADCNDNLNIIASGSSTETSTNNEGTTWIPSSSIGSDGTYYWCAQNNDASFTSNWTSMGSFVLDTTNPIISSGGQPPGSRRPPAPPEQGFKVLINSGDIFTNSRDISLKLIAGSDTKKMAISNNPDLKRGTGQISYQSLYTWDLCYQQKECPDGVYTVYAKFYTQYGQASEVVSDTIILDTTAPEIKRINIKDYYRPDENIVLSGKTEAKAEIILHWDEKYGSVSADDSGFWIANLGKLSVGKYPLGLTPKDRAGNVGESLTVDLIIEAVSIPSKPPEIVPEKPEEIITVPEEAPLAMQGQWQLLPSKPIREFVLAPLPKEIRELAKKFPELEETFEKVGITKITDVSKLKTVELTLPGLTEKLGLPTVEVQPGKFALPKGVPVAELSPEIKEQLPTEIVFAKTGGQLIDFNIALSVTEKGKPEQRISTVSGKPLQLVVKPEKPVKSVKGYVVFKSKKKELGVKNQELSLNSLLASMVFASPSFAEEHSPIEIEERLVLLEFEYTDPDGDGIYTAEIQAPIVEGEYEIITVMDFEDPELGRKEIRLIAVVDPEGYVYEKDRDKETRIPGAIVSLYWLNSETKQYELWPAKEYQQENPQITDATGKYSFLVPEGSYYLKVEAPSYLIYDGKPFQVKEGSGVHVNIELKTKYWWLKVVDWKTILLIAVILLLLYNFYRDKIRERLLRRQSK